MSGTRTLPWALAAGALLAASCGDIGEDALQGDYTNCGSAVVAEQKDVCDDLLTGVVWLCGFDLTVDPCACTSEVEGCTADTAWLDAITACLDNATGCVDYVTCLEDVGTSTTGCTSPATWDCIVPAASGGGV